MENSELKPNGQSNSSNKLRKISSEGVFMSVTKKAEKITTALYMITDLVPEKDPIRNKIREGSLEVLSDTRRLSYALTGDLYFHLARIISKSWELVSLMEVAVVVGFISDMNYGILKNALVEFISNLRNRQRMEGFSSIQDLKFVEGEAGNLSLKSDFFRVEEGASDEEKSFIPERPVQEKVLAPVATPKISKGQSSAPKPQEGSAKMDDRKQKIIALIQDKKDISITDIVSFFKEYSQKTVQRDLAALVQDGKIKRVGEKRWSRYSVL